MFSLYLKYYILHGINLELVSGLLRNNSVQNYVCCHLSKIHMSLLSSYGLKSLNQFRSSNNVLLEVSCSLTLQLYFSCCFLQYAHRLASLASHDNFLSWFEHETPVF